METMNQICKYAVTSAGQVCKKFSKVEETYLTGLSLEEN